MSASLSVQAQAIETCLRNISAIARSAGMRDAQAAMLREHLRAAQDTIREKDAEQRVKR